MRLKHLSLSFEKTTLDLYFLFLKKKNQYPLLFADSSFRLLLWDAAVVCSSGAGPFPFSPASFNPSLCSLTFWRINDKQEADLCGFSRWRQPLSSFPLPTLQLKTKLHFCFGWQREQFQIKKWDEEEKEKCLRTLWSCSHNTLKWVGGGNGRHSSLSISCNSKKGKLINPELNRLSPNTRGFVWN